MNDSLYEELLPRFQQRPPSSSVSSAKLWYFCISTFLCGMVVMLLVAWPRVLVMQAIDVSLDGMNLNQTNEAVHFNANVSLQKPRNGAQSLFDPTVKTICTMQMSSTNDTLLSLSCERKQALLLSALLLKGSWSGAATSWYAIVAYVLLGLVILAGVVWLLYPKTPEVTLENLQLRGLSTDGEMPSKDTYYLPKLAVDVGVVIALRIRNPNFVGFSYEKLTLHVSYNSYELCNAEINGDAVAARGESTVNTGVKVKLAQILYNAPNLVADAATQELPVNLVVQFSGYVGYSRWLKAPLTVAVSLDAKLDVINADVVDQDYHLV